MRNEQWKAIYDFCDEYGMTPFELVTILYMRCLINGNLEELRDVGDYDDIYTYLINEAL